MSRKKAKRKESAPDEEAPSASRAFMERMGQLPALTFEWLPSSSVRYLEDRLHKAHRMLSLLDRGTTFLYAPSSSDNRPRTDTGEVPNEADARETYVYDRCWCYRYLSLGIRKQHRHAWDKMLVKTELAPTLDEVEDWRRQYRAFVNWLLKVLEAHMIEHLDASLTGTAAAIAKRDLWPEGGFSAQADWEENLIGPIYAELLLCVPKDVADDGPQTSDEAKAPKDSHRATHSPDFTSIDWCGTHYTFTKGRQAECVRALWEVYQKGGHGLTQETLRDRCDSKADRFELSKVFRGNPAWGTLIKPESKGVYRLDIPVPPEQD